MSLGPGKYDAECTDVRVKHHAEAVLLIVIRGEKGSGFSCQATPEFTAAFPQLLRGVADQIEREGVYA